MKSKLLPVFFIMFSLLSCSVDPIEEEIGEDQIISLNSETGDPGCAGADQIKNITFSEASAIESWDEVRKLYLSLLPAGTPRNGTFDPSIWDLIHDFEVRGIGEYSTIYSLTGDCTDSVILTINVIADPVNTDPCEAFSAGPDNFLEITLSEAEAIPSWDEVRKLYLSLLAPGVPRNGEFEPSIWDLIDSFGDPNRESKLGDYTTTYTITQGDCQDSVELTIKVIPNFTDPIECDIDAGSDKIREMKESDAAAIPSWDEVRKLYLSLLDPGVPRNGEFDPSIWDLIDAFNDPNRASRLGDYTTTYTITDGDCTDSVELTIRVVAD
ncbi:hypothetical protein MKO06_08320 [Gramella sp. GC03-9]|uniref:Uncharacterized protein n=1 Tax=Christiangramia oceanisediminis TaxID=2920386 RepID=A0A9X2I5R2_9FLAO|nr:hypothetical protein [Gramella oceanisediminis]MCP9199907.1 hypothetical protein [Gramella oceanisediminis]